MGNHYVFPIYRKFQAFPRYCRAKISQSLFIAIKIWPKILLLDQPVFYVYMHMLRNDQFLNIEPLN